LRATKKKKEKKLITFCLFILYSWTAINFNLVLLDLEWASERDVYKKISKRYQLARSKLFCVCRVHPKKKIIIIYLNFFLNIFFFYSILFKFDHERAREREREKNAHINYPISLIFGAFSFNKQTRVWDVYSSFIELSPFHESAVLYKWWLEGLLKYDLYFL
jgi:hypothetical protein